MVLQPIEIQWVETSFRPNKLQHNSPWKTKRRQRRMLTIWRHIFDTYGNYELHFAPNPGLVEIYSTPLRETRKSFSGRTHRGSTRGSPVGLLKLAPVCVCVYLPSKLPVCALNNNLSDIIQHRQKRKILPSLITRSHQVWHFSCFSCINCRRS